MARWTFEPGHTAAEFKARHMMVSWVRGSFKNVHGSLLFDPDNPRASSVEAETTINRHDFGVSWQDSTFDNGVVVGDEVRITLDAEAIKEEEAQRGPPVCG